MSTPADGLAGDRPDHTVEVIGQSSRTIESLVADEEVAVVEREVAFECLSGATRRSTWTGFPVGDLLDGVDVPPDTTHLVVESSDGHRACVPTWTALDGLLAVECDGDPLDGPRFVASDVDGPRSVKDVRTIECLALPPGENPSAYERLTRDDD